MAEQEGGSGGEEVAFSFMDKVRFMMYGEQEKEAFLIEKKEKEEKKKAKKAEKALKKAEKEKKKKQESSGETEAPQQQGETEAPQQQAEEEAGVSAPSEKQLTSKEDATGSAQ